MLCHADSQNTVVSVAHRIVTAGLNWWLAVSDSCQECLKFTGLIPSQFQEPGLLLFESVLIVSLLYHILAAVSSMSTYVYPESWSVINSSGRVNTTFPAIF